MSYKNSAPVHTPENCTVKPMPFAANRRSAVSTTTHRCSDWGTRLDTWKVRREWTKAGKRTSKIVVTCDDVNLGLAMSLMLDEIELAHGSMDAVEVSREDDFEATFTVRFMRPSLRFPVGEETWTIFRAPR